MVNLKKRLESSVRGWFPHEPKPSKSTPRSLEKMASPMIPQTTPIGDGSENSPYLLVLFLPIALVINFFIGYDVIVQYLFRGIPPVSSRLDMWFTTHYFGSFNPGTYVTLLVAFYLLSFLVGLICSWALLSPIFGSLLRHNTVTIKVRRFVAGAVVDVFVGILIFMVVVNPILEYVSNYPVSLGAATSSGASTMSFYLFAGFITGSCLMKLLFPISVFVRSRMKHLSLISQSIYLDSKSKSRHPDGIRWDLIPNAENSSHLTKEGTSSTL